MMFQICHDHWKARHDRHGEVVQRIQRVWLVTPDDGGDDVFVHFSQIMTQTLTTLLEGQKVSFTVADGPTGKQATGIEPL